MKVNMLIAGLVRFIIGLLLSSAVFAGMPVFTFTPLTATTLTVSSTGTATVQYIVTNQSSLSNTIIMTPIAGITQTTTAGNCSSPFTLGGKQSCTLTLLVNGSQLPASIQGGPEVCKQEANGNPSPFICYQPSVANRLNITLVTAAKYMITPSSGANGSIAANTPQTVNSGSNLSFTATPNMNYMVNQWLVDGDVVQTGGTTYTLSNVTTNHSVLVTFTPTSILMLGLYAGVANGNVYHSTNNGNTWTATSSPPSAGNPVNSIFATASTLYAGSADHHVYFSTNNGASWSSTSVTPDASAVNSVFVTTSNTLYIGTAGGHVYHSTDNGTTWTATSNSPSTNNAVNGLFITSSAALYAGSANGNVYYSTDGITWIAINGSPDGSAIRNVFVTNSRLYVNTANEYVYRSRHLTGGGAWATYAQSVYSLFANSDGSIIDAGTQGGYVSSLTTGSELGFVTYSPINSVFFLG